MTCDYKNLQTELALEDTGLIFLWLCFHLMSILMMTLVYQVFSISKINSWFPVLSSSIAVSVIV